MSEEFTPITTQEQLNDVIKDRLNRQAEKHSKDIEALNAKYADYDSIRTKLSETESSLTSLQTASAGYTDRIAELERTIAERDANIAAQATAAMKAGIVREFGLPAEMANRLNGSTEEEIRKDAEALAGIFRTKQPPAPTYHPDGAGKENADLMSVLKNLNLKGN